MITASVSAIESYRWWSESGDLDWEWFLKNCLRSSQTPNMAAGEALHKALETAMDGDHDSLTANGYTFVFHDEFDGTLPSGKCVEVPCSKAYGVLTVRGRVDLVRGNVVRDYKFRVGSVDADKVESYLDSYQWRFYLDMMGADAFEYIVFEAVETDNPMCFVIRNMHTVTQYRYPDLERDCAAMAAKYMAAATLKPELVKVAA